ncbi:MAG: gliding motility-associated C-terminal domain-containing protein [Saprospiraceae bacterium]|nr:gliding motility-associated C-terminal domain-containing protein [Candidatus Vicinibacter affinis]
MISRIFETTVTNVEEGFWGCLKFILTDSFKKFHPILFLLIGTTGTFAQTDTIFWFAAPDVSYGYANFDKPILLRIANPGKTSLVTVTQPANPGFNPIVVSVAAGSSTTIDLTPWLGQIENAPPDKILNYGLMIKATNPVTIYYEVMSTQCACNPEIFALKGNNALGNDFFIPMQNFLDNANYNPTPYSSFDIVATEDGTKISIFPSNDVVGHQAKNPFVIILNKGQTYSATAVSQSASKHLDGSRVSSDKPIAITIKDDLMFGAPFGGGCADLGGDQLIPLTILGSEYIAVRGFLNAPYDKVFILATQNNTVVNVNQNPVAVLNAGETYVHNIGNNISAYIKASLPVYALQMSGFGCEVGLSILPPIFCTGSRTVAFTRSLNEPIFITLLVKSGGEGSFLLNGKVGEINASQFSLVPGTNGKWMSAQIPLTSAQAPVAVSSVISNDRELFHLGVIHGTVGGGCRFGYFSNFNKVTADFAVKDTVCQGETVSLYYNGQFGSAAEIEWKYPDGELVEQLDESHIKIKWNTPGLHFVTLTINDAECLDMITKPVYVTSGTTNSQIVSACDSYTWPVNGFNYFKSGFYTDTFSTIYGCDSVELLDLTISPSYFISENVMACDSFIWPKDGKMYKTGGVYIKNLPSANGCDSILRLDLKILTSTKIIESKTSCNSWYWPVTGLVYVNSGTYTATLKNQEGCDSNITLDLHINPSYKFTEKVSICDSYLWKVTGKMYTKSGRYIDTLFTSTGCDSIHILDLEILSSEKTKEYQTSCDSWYWPVNQKIYNSSGTYTESFTTLSGCDSIHVLELIIKPSDQITDTLSKCGSYLWPVDGVVYTKSGEYKKLFMNADGCDSIFVLNLSILNNSSSRASVSACSRYKWEVNGQTFEKSGTYSWSTVNTQGCDSTIYLDLAIYPEYKNEDTARACGNFFWPVSGMNYEQSGTYYKKLQSLYGCDSTYIINLKVDPEFILYDTVTNLENYFWPVNNEYYHESGQYQEWFHTVEGCDSLRILILTILRRGNVYVPNVFSPNGDGINDRVTVFSSPEVKKIDRFRIYDRWGELLFQQSVFPPNDEFFGWDGTLLGKLVNPGVFVYHVEWTDQAGDKHMEKGDLTLLR